MWVRIPPEAAHFFFEKKKKETSQLVVLCHLALFDVSENHVHVQAVHVGSLPK